MCGSNKSSASLTAGVLMSLRLHSSVAASRIARASKTVIESVASSFNRCGYDRDNSYKTHRAKRLDLLQVHCKDHEKLEGTPK